MLTSILAASALATLQSSKTTVEAGSVYGTETHSAYEEFGMNLAGMVVVFPPSDPTSLSLALNKDGKPFREATQLVFEATPYENFIVTSPTNASRFTTSGPGDYEILIRDEGRTIARYPFTVVRVPADDEFNPTQLWDLITPLDNMGTLQFGNAHDTQVSLSAWISPNREGLTAGKVFDATLYVGDTAVASGKAAVQERSLHNQQFSFVMKKSDGHMFKKSDLLAHKGTVTARIVAGEKTVRTFTWSLSEKGVALHPRSKTGFEPHDLYLVPRTIANTPSRSISPQLDEVYWAESK